MAAAVGYIGFRIGWIQYTIFFDMTHIVVVNSYDTYIHNVTGIARTHFQGEN